MPSGGSCFLELTLASTWMSQIAQETGCSAWAKQAAACQDCAERGAPKLTQGMVSVSGMDVKVSALRNV